MLEERDPRRVAFATCRNFGGVTERAVTFRFLPDILQEYRAEEKKKKKREKEENGRERAERGRISHGRTTRV